MEYRDVWQPSPVRPPTKKLKRGCSRIAYIYAVTDGYSKTCTYLAAEFLKVYSHHEALE